MSLLMTTSVTHFSDKFVTIELSVAPELRGSGAHDTCCNRVVAEQVWMNDFVMSLDASGWLICLSFRRVLRRNAWCSSFNSRRQQRHANLGSLWKIFRGNRQRHIEEFSTIFTMKNESWHISKNR